MKLLEIRDSLGYYRDGNGDLVPLDKITKEDLLRLVELTLSEEAEFDAYDDDAVKNQAHKILYKSIFEKMVGLRDRKEEFMDESGRLYLQEYEKYRDKPSQQGNQADGQ
jgi:hypothetical protein